MSEHQIVTPGTGRSRNASRERRVPIAGAVGLAVLLQGCASSGFLTRPLTTPPSRVEAQLLEATQPPEPVILVFAWRFSERGSRVEGRGVARIEPPYRARLDLFTENGETAATAALVNGDLRVPPEMDRRLIPPAPLLWASLGVFHPGSGAELLGGEALVVEDEEVEEVERPESHLRRLRYRMPSGGEARFVSREGSLEAAELLEGDRVVERVELERREDAEPVQGSPSPYEADAPYPAGAVYRDRSAFRELRVTLESREPADSFAPDIWLPQW